MRIGTKNSICAIFATTVLLFPIAARAEPVPVNIANSSVVTKCAEEDNVYVKFLSPDVTSFRIDSVQPHYSGKIRLNKMKPDFSNCKISAAKDFKTTPRDAVLYEDDDIIVKGITYGGFWRKETATVNIGQTHGDGWHLLQVFTKKSRMKNGQPFEFFVMYPSDGYWRSRMMPQKGRKDNVYGASFLVGPIEEQGRPIADVAEVSLDPKARRFDISFRKGGKAHVTFGEPTPEILSVDVKLERDPANASLPFAAFRSMYVSEQNADTSRIMIKEPGSKDFKGGLIHSVKGGKAVEVKLDRVVPSRHNTNAPDFIFKDFNK